MRYPVGNGSREDFESRFYVASSFGEFRGTYYHSGADINLKTGGDTDLGEPIHAILPGKLVYYHIRSHPDSLFGIHNVYKVNTPFGFRWVHSAHLYSKDALGEVKELTEGDLIGRIGKSGTTYAHLHMTVFKKDPAQLVKGIDTVFKNKRMLLEWCEDPIEFLHQLNEGGSMGDSALDACLKDREMFWKERDELLKALEAGTVEEGKRVIGGLRSRITDLGNQLGTAQAEAKTSLEEISRLEKRLSDEEQVNNDLSTRLNEAKAEADTLAEDKKSLAIEVSQLEQKLETAKQAQEQGEFRVTLKELFFMVINQKIVLKRNNQ